MVEMRLRYGNHRKSLYVHFYGFSRFSIFLKAFCFVAFAQERNSKNSSFGTITQSQKNFFPRLNAFCTQDKKIISLCKKIGLIKRLRKEISLKRRYTFHQMLSILKNFTLSAIWLCLMVSK